MTNVPVFILSRDRMSVQHVIEWFEKAEGVERIAILDHATTYEPLLAYYESIQGTHQIYESQVDDPYTQFVAACRRLVNGMGRFMIVDCDMLFTGCPTNLIPYCMEALDRYDDVLKCGPGLWVTDLPPTLPCLKQVLATELQWWVKPISLDPTWFEANLDTTCALHDADRAMRKVGRFMRSDSPYMIRHLTWYLNPANVPEDELYYYRHAKRKGWHAHVLEPQDVSEEWEVPFWMGRDALPRYAHLIETAGKIYRRDWNHNAVRNAQWTQPTT